MRYGCNLSIGVYSVIPVNMPGDPLLQLRLNKIGRAKKIFLLILFVNFFQEGELSDFAAGLPDVCLPHETSQLHASNNSPLTASRTSSQTASRTSSQTASRTTSPSARNPSQTRTSQTWHTPSGRFATSIPAIPSPPCFYIPTTDTSIHNHSITEPPNGSSRQSPIVQDTSSMTGSNCFTEDAGENNIGGVTHRSFSWRPSGVEDNLQENTSDFQQRISQERVPNPLDILPIGDPSVPLQTPQFSAPSSNSQDPPKGGDSSHFSQNNSHIHRKSPRISPPQIHTARSTHTHILVTPISHIGQEEQLHETNALALINHLYRSLNFSPINPAHNTALYQHNPHSPNIYSSTPVNYKPSRGAPQKCKIPQSTSPIPKISNKKAAVTNAWNRHENKAVKPVIMLPSCSTTPQSSTSAAPLPHFQQSSHHHRPFRGLHAF